MRGCVHICGMDDRERCGKCQHTLHAHQVSGRMPAFCWVVGCECWGFVYAARMGT